MRILSLLLLLKPLLCAATGAIVPEVRAAIAQKDFARGEAAIHAYRAQQGVTPEMILALSWLGRGALASKDYGKAEGYAAETRKLALEALKTRKLDDEKNLPLALGASIEVQAHSMDGRGERGEAVSFLRKELAAWRDTSMRARIQKNIHLLSLEGKPAPALETSKWLGPRPAALDKLKGRPVLLFFWAHWCGDCKGQASALTQIASEYRSKGLVLVGPTQHYGYVSGGEDATPDRETPYIESIRTKFYSSLGDMPVPISEENFKSYGASTTPTLVLVDRKGIVRLYHPGAMPLGELESKIKAVVAD